MIKATDFLVGLFMLGGVIAFAYLAINIGGMQLFEGDYYRVTAEFDDVSGLEQGSSVEIAGVPVGEVEHIDLNDTSAAVTLQLRKAVSLRDDDIASIRTKGIIGDRYVKIIPGSSDEKIVDGGRLFDTESAVQLEDLIGKFVHSLE